MTDPLGRDPDVLTTKELAAKLGLSAQTVRRMASAGQIPALRTGKDYRYSWNAVLDVLQQPHPIAGGSGNEESRPGAGRLATQQARDRAAREL
ncbi:helix-turn-helix domain-containing protein [Microbispora hainanensis]|jgi:excisionase family DNA binding protein|uniref:Helix-turn-helix domain-containing protein n=1 Tax=Microbispora hainanensis TaxID=568844 RepID=A0ABZ1ST05_9ACTN|nr:MULTISPECIES: helix-turn-helix domain-containing protein [Microbispora]NJP29513.1 helix-turn-helix domain-containing protein [Microbispora sp. CL1-1]TQS04982.1 helix-turn-helix domain-containing protein [Microbispora sp. SCL1-1]